MDNVLSVINIYNVRFPLEVYRFFKEIGAHYMQSLPPSWSAWDTNRPDGLKLPPTRADDATLLMWTVRPEDFGQFYITIAPTNGCATMWGDTSAQLFDATLANSWRLASVCIFGRTLRHAAAMEFNGDVCRPPCSRIQAGQPASRHYH